MNDLATGKEDDPTVELEMLPPSAEGRVPAFGQVADDARRIQQIGELEVKNSILQSELDFKNELIEMYRKEIKSLQLKSLRAESPRVTADPPVTGTDVQIKPAEMRMLVGINAGVPARHAIHPGSTSVGSGPDNDIRLQGNFVSRHHAQILSNAGGCVICDLNSTNGTFVNANRIKKHSLHEGDELIFGTLRFKFVTQPDPATDESPD